MKVERPLGGRGSGDGYAQTGADGGLSAMICETERVELAVIGMAVSSAGAARLADYWHGVVNGAPPGQGEPSSESARRPSALDLLEAACVDASYTARRSDAERACVSPRDASPAASYAHSEDAEDEADSLSSVVAERFGLGRVRLFVEATGSARTFACIKPLLEELRSGRRDVLLTVGVGEGGGAALAFTRLDDARRLGHRVYAILKKVTASAREDADAEGQATDSFLFNADGLLFNEDACAGRDSVGLVEAALCGSGLSVEEAFRLLARAHASQARPAPRTAFDCTGAGHGPRLLSLVKAALALHDKVLPASSAATDAGAHAEGTTLYVNGHARPWIHAEGRGPRRASLYEFGPSGPSAHVLLEEHSGHAGSKLVNGEQPTELLCFSAETQAELLSLVSDVQSAVGSCATPPLSHLSYTLALRVRGSRRLAVLASGAADLARKLETVKEKLSGGERPRWQLREGIYYGRTDEGEAPARVAFMFPGYGSYYPRMLADLCVYFPPVRAWFDTLDGIFDEAEGSLPSHLLFPPGGSPQAGRREAAEAKLHGVRGGAQGGFTATLALHELLQNLGVRCDVMLGHSNGENAALIASGTMRFGARRELFDLLCRVTEHDDRVASDSATPVGVFLGVSGCAPELIEQLTAAAAGRLHLAMDNCPHQVVLFGGEADIEDATRRIKEAGGIALRLPFDRAYHTPFYEAQAEGLRAIYETIEFGPGHTRLYSCATARPFPAEPDEIRVLALRQWSSSVRFRETLLELYREGVRTFIEVGPNSTLTGFAADTLRDREHLAVAANTQRLPDLEQLQRLLAQLYVRGADLNLEYLFRFRNVERVELSKAEPSEAELSRPGLSRAAATTRATCEAGGARVEQTARVSQQPPSGNGKPSEGEALVHIRPPGEQSAAATRATHGAQAFSADGRSPAAQTEAGAAVTDVRAAILDGHFELMQSFLASQGRVLSSLFPGAVSVAQNGARPSAHADEEGARSRPRVDEVESRAWPLLGEVVESDGRRLHCRRRFDLRHDTFLLDHTLGRRAEGTHARQPPLPVVPFTVSMEILAEAASRLSGGSMAVIGMRDVRGHRWLTLEQSDLVLDVLAEAQTPPDAKGQDVRVQIFETAPDGRRQLSFEGTVRLAREYPPPPAPLRPPLTETRPAEVSAEDFYRRFAFHGPCFQGIKRLRAWDDGAIEVEMEVPQTEGFFKGATAAAFQTPAGLLDNTGQLVGLWLLERGQRELAVFPFHAAGFEQYEAPRAGGSRLLCRASVRLHERATSEADFDFMDMTGRVVARLTGLQLKNSFGRHIPKILKPQAASSSYFSDPWLEAETGIACRRVAAATAALLEDGRGIWKRALARQVLCERELKFWSGLTEKGRRRAEWLAGRVTAKDAVRRWAERKFGLLLAPEEVEICADERGRPFARCAALESRGAVPHISISHSHGDTVAVAADLPVGVDSESLSVPRDAWRLAGILGEDESSLVARGDAPALLSLWCAKEAAAKAAGTGLLGDARAWRVVDCLHGAERVRVEHESGSFEVELWRRDGVVFALARPLAPHP